MPTCDYCGFTVPDPCYSFKQMAERFCPVLTVPIETTPRPSGPPLEAPAPKVSQENLKNAHWDIWKKGYVAPPDPWVPENYIRDVLKNQPGGIVGVAHPGQFVYADMPKPKSDPINHPRHYARWHIEPIEFISVNKLPAWLANVIKYAMRYDAKDGLKDLYKARSYLDMEIRRLEGVERFWEVPVAEERRLNAA